MSKKDYQAIARAIHEVKTRADVRPDSGALAALLADTVDALSDVFATDNPRFDRERFLEACETGRCRGMRQVA